MPSPQIDWTQPLPRVVHGTSVSLDGAGLLIIGPSGSGKSSLALQIMSLGAGLVSDDLTHLAHHRDVILASCPAATDAVFGIEARGLGLLNATPSGPAGLRAIVDLGSTARERLPHRRMIDLQAVQIPCLARVDSPAFPAMLLQFLRFGLHLE